jgi:hypothetical protein
MKVEVQHYAQNNTVYGMGFIGALVYFIAQATSFKLGIIGFFKAIVWPAMLVYYALGNFGA